MLFSLDFLDILLVFMIAILLAYAVYAVRTVLKEMDNSEQLWVDVKNMHYIPFSLPQIQNGLLGSTTKASDDRAQWKEFVMKVELLYAARYHLLKASLVEDYDPFDPNRDTRVDLPQTKMQLLEDRFFSNFRHMLEKANFDMLTEEESETASAHNFLNTVPIEPEWLKMDPIFTRYMELHPEFAQGAFAGATRMWIFHRGVGMAKFHGMLVMQKLDALLFQLFGRCCGKKKKATESDKGKAEAVPSQPKVEAPKGQGVERITIHSQVKAHGWGSLLKPSDIQEPTYKEVVICYRVNHGRDPMSGSENPNNIFVKIFRDIPHADLEVLYPCKHTTLRPLDVVKFVGAGVFGLISILMQRRAGELVGYSALTGFLTLAVSVLFDYQYHQSVYEQTTLRDLYSKSKDSDRGAINYLMEEVGLQEVKEVFLAYFFLVQSNKPQSQEDLDERVEAFLMEMQTVLGHKECKIDFEVDDALDKLIKMKLVTKEDGEKFTAIPLVEGIDLLNEAWAGLIAQSAEK